MEQRTAGNSEGNHDSIDSPSVRVLVFLGLVLPTIDFAHTQLVSTEGASRARDIRFAEAVKKAHSDIPAGAVELITTPKQANKTLVEGEVDIVLPAGEFLRESHFDLNGIRAHG